MPVLNLGIRRSGYGVAQQPRSTPDNFGAQGFEALGELGNELVKVQKQKEALNLAIKDGEDSVKGTQAITSLALKMEEAEQFARTNADPENHLAVWREQVTEAQRQTQESFKGFSQEKRTQFEQTLAKVLSSAEIGVARNQQDRRIDRQVADGSKSFGDLIDLATRAPTAEQRAALVEQAATVPMTLARNGALKETQAAEWIQRGKEKIVQGRAAHFATGLKQELDNLQNEAFRNPANVEDLFNRGQRRIKDAGSDWLPADKIEATIAEFKNGLYVGAIKNRIDENPDKAKAELKSGKYDDKLSQQALISLNTEADVEIDRRRREAEARRKEGLRLIGKEVDDFAKASRNGDQWAGNVGQLHSMVRGTEHEREFLEAVRDAQSMAKFGQMSLIEQEQFLRSGSQTPKTGSESDLYRKMQSAHSEARTEIAKDPIAYAIRKRIIPGLMPFDINNPASLKERNIAAGMVTQRLGVSVSPLSDDEAKKLIADMAKAPADQKALMMRQFNQNFTPAQAQSLAAQIDKKGAGELAQAFGMSGQVPEVTSRILQGMEAKKANEKILPAGAELRDMDTAINKKLADAYKADPNALESVRDAVKSYYAWGRWNVGDLSAKLDSKALDRAIYAVSGGVMDFNGAPTLPPRYGVTEKQMRDMITRADFSNVLGDIKAKTVLDYGKLIAVGPGLYRVTIGGSPVFDKNNKPFTLDLSRVEAPK